MGAETEYAVHAVSEGAVPSPADLAYMLLYAAEDRLPSVRDIDEHGIFLPSGGRLYVDAGHLELATPEYDDPFELTRAIVAGDRLVAALAEGLRFELPRGTRVVVRKGNVHYTAPYSTWGAHESYLVRQDPLEVAPHLLAFLVTRPVIAGAGGWNPFARSLEFCLSPRAMHFQDTISGDSTGRRPIFHVKGEPLCEGPFDRVHVILAEGLLSHTGLVLRHGTTALVLAAIDAGAAPAESLELENPIAELHRTARDPLFDRFVNTRVGARRSALDVQRYYLETVRSSLRGGSLPPWGEVVCGLWRNALDALEEDATNLDKVLDWRIKRSLFRAHVERSGFTWREFEQCGELVGSVLSRSISLDDLDWFSPGNLDLMSYVFLPRPFGLAQIRRYFELSRELLELDERFADLGPSGLFRSLDRAGILEHALTEVGPDERDWMPRPPRWRGRLRGEEVARLSGRRDSARCDWDRVVDWENGTWLDLGDPFETGERRYPVPPDWTARYEEEECPF
jgi:hypothetical protein